MRSRVLSLCSGYGGLEMGLELAGVDVDLVAYAEFDKYASKVMEHHHPGVPNLGDIKTVQWQDQWAPGDIDILTAGYPCQPFSQAGKRLGTDDPLHLWPYIAEAICHLRPRHVFLENVRGHVTKGLKEVLADLADLGYVGSWRCVRASDVGACHRRERVFIVASDAERPLGWAEVRECQEAGRDLGARGWLEGAATPLGDRPTVADTSGGELQRRGVGRVVPCEQGTTVGDQAERQRDGHASVDGREDVADPDRERFTVGAERHGGSTQPGLAASCGDDTGGRRESAPDPSDLGREWVGDTWRRWCGDPHHREVIDWGKFAPAIERWERVLGRPAPRPTEGDKHRLNPVFVEWMMGLPAGWVTAVDGISRTQQLKILGNGVVPQQATVAWTLAHPQPAGEVSAAATTSSP